MNAGKSRELTVLVGCVAAGGLGVLAGALFSWGSEEMTFLLALAALAVLTEIFDFTPIPNSRVSLSICLIFAAGTMSGLPGVAVIASTAAIVDYILHRKPATKAVFNEGVMLVSGAAFVGVLEAFAPLYDSGDWIAVLGPALLGCVAAFALNSALVSLAIALDTGSKPLEIWDSGFRWLLPHYVVLAALALLLAVAYDRWEIAGMALLLAPLGMAWLIVKQYVDRLSGPSAAVGTGS